VGRIGICDTILLTRTFVDYILDYVYNCSSLTISIKKAGAM
jgi:hypothetical protein